MENSRNNDIIADSFRSLQEMLENLRRPYSNIATVVVRSALSKLSSDKWKQFFIGEKVELPYYDMETLISALYENIVDTYIGVDSNLPSDFIKIHPYLLEDLINTIREDSSYPPSGHPIRNYCHGRHLVRIISVMKEDLQSDYRKNQKDFEYYMRYHQNLGRGGILLLSVDPNVAREAKGDDLWTTDVGLWIRNCAVLFKSGITPDKKIDLQLVHPFSQDPVKRNMFERCVLYVKKLIEQSERIIFDKNRGIIETGNLEEDIKEDLFWSLDELVEPDLAEVWYEFVDAERRMKALEGDFLEKEVLSRFKKEEVKIYDAASGVGAETVWLKEHGYDVTPNEIVWKFIEDARKLAAERLGPNASFSVWAYDWRHLAQKVPRDMFDVVLVLGNSLTCLMTHKEMKKCLEGFHHVLKPDGLLVIDERNYRYIVNHRNEVLKADYRFPQKVVYPSKKIRAKPSPHEFPRQLGQPMILEYYNCTERKGTWKVYAFREDEMEQLLQEDKLFKVINRYWDFRKKPNPDAEFITYVAQAIKKNK